MFKPTVLLAFGISSRGLNEEIHSRMNVGISQNAKKLKQINL